MLTLTLGVGLAMAACLVLMGMRRRWAHASMADLGFMSERWLEEHRASYARE